MDLANSDSINEIAFPPCNCFKVASLKTTILDSVQISNFNNRYILGEQLGWGQFGIIRECLDMLTGELLACKSISKERLVTVDDVRSIKLEIDIMTNLSGHPNVVDLKAVYEEEDYVHLVMELCAGGELFHWLEKLRRFSEKEARFLFRHLMEVVSYCHDKGIVHRDLKPENILLATKSSPSQIKLADFGLATYIKPGQNLQGTVGSPFYIAPEVLSGGYNQAVDVWSAGVILYILLSGMPPFWGKTKSKIFDAVRAADLQFPSEPWDSISASAKDLIMGMLSQNSAKRLTAAEVLAHSWMKDPVQTIQEPPLCENSGDHELAACGNSPSVPFVSRNQDYSFSDGSIAVIGDAMENSPAFTCKSSFSSYPIDHDVPCSVAGGFSFSSCCEANAPGFSSPIPSMPSFTFFRPNTAVEQGNESLGCFVKIPTHRDSCSRKLFVLPGLSQTVGCKLSEMDHSTELRRGAKSRSKSSSTHSKRNHTIGLGECDQLDLMVTESVIRWASCTQIPSAPSLRTRLVC